MKIITFITTYFLWSASCIAQLQIVGIEQGGILTFQGGTLSNFFTLEYAPSVTGPWTNWGSLTDQPITGSVMVAAGPMFFRVKSSEDKSFSATTTKSGFLSVLNFIPSNLHRPILFGTNTM